jgi:hypothetical protein
MLSARGYALQGFENVLGRSLPAGSLPPRTPGIEVAPSPPEELPAWVDVVVTGFASPDGQGVPSHESYPRELVESVMAAEGLRSPVHAGDPRANAVRRR